MDIGIRKVSLLITMGDGKMEFRCVDQQQALFCDTWYCTLSHVRVQVMACMGNKTFKRI